MVSYIEEGHKLQVLGTFRMQEKRVRLTLFIEPRDIWWTGYVAWMREAINVHRILETKSNCKSEGVMGIY
jgi:hypothetical protein